jgi:adenine-specific DNA-methyltransferase
VRSQFTGFSSIQEPGYTTDGTRELEELFGDKILEFPKPKELVNILLRQGTEAENNDIVLDFFAGSGTTADAVCELNSEDHGNRKFILVQLPEPTNRKDYPTIVDITKERVRRVCKKLDEADSGKLDLQGKAKQDRGFKVFKLAESNFRAWDADTAKDADSLAKQLELHIHHIRDGRTEQDILFELLLKSGFSLTAPVELLQLAGKPVYSVGNGLLVVCLDRALTLELIRAIAERKPQRVVCLDDGFAGNDQLKANAVQIFKTKGITTFKTV